MKNKLTVHTPVRIHIGVGHSSPVQVFQAAVKSGTAGVHAALWNAHCPVARLTVRLFKRMHTAGGAVEPQVAEQTIVVVAVAWHNILGREGGHAMMSESRQRGAEDGQVHGQVHAAACRRACWGVLTL